MSTCLPLPERSYTKLKQENHILSLTKNVNLNAANSDCFKAVNFCDKRNKCENQKTWEKNKVQEEESRFIKNKKNDIWNPQKPFQNLINIDKKENEKWKNECHASSANNSTLSLHIAAYENMIDFADISKVKEIKIFEKNFFHKKWWEDVNKRRICRSSREKIMVEIPRGGKEEDESNEPEIMQFKASQKLLDPNKFTTESNHQNSALPPVTAKKDIDGIDKMLDVPTAPLKPIKKRSTVALVADLSKCPKIDVDDYISRLMTSVDKDGNITDYLTDTSVIEQICVLAIENLSKQPSLLELSPKINVVGDIHGQFTDLLRIFDLCGSPACTKYLFLGDYVDRGPHSLEVICLLLLLRIRYPETFFLLRGNHECSNINRVYGFFRECEKRFQRIPINEAIWGVTADDLKGTHVWYRFQDVFNWLPLTALIGKKILCMHGGLSPDLVSLDQLRNLVRPIDPDTAGIHIDLLWADPDVNLPNKEYIDWGPSARGISSHFSVQAVNTACQQMGLDLIVRGHQVVQDGYEFFGNRKLVTIFSAPNYCGDYNNSGAIMTVDITLEASFHIIKPLQSGKKKSKDLEVDIDDIDLDALIAEGSAEKC